MNRLNKILAEKLERDKANIRLRKKLGSLLRRNIKIDLDMGITVKT
jgi:hypothetical protein